MTDDERGSAKRVNRILDQVEVAYKQVAKNQDYEVRRRQDNSGAQINFIDDDENGRQEVIVSVYDPRKVHEESEEARLYDTEIGTLPKDAPTTDDAPGSFGLRITAVYGHEDDDGIYHVENKYVDSIEDLSTENRLPDTLRKAEQKVHELMEETG